MGSNLDNDRAEPDQERQEGDLAEINNFPWQFHSGESRQN